MTTAGPTSGAASRAAGDGAAVGVALVGAGRIARMVHLPLLRDASTARLVAVVDADPAARAAAAAAAPGALVTADLHPVLARPDVAAVVVATPTHTHPQVALAALAAGKHVYVEKPLAAQLGPARRVLAAWEAQGAAAGLVAAVGHSFRFVPALVDLRQASRDGHLGLPVAVRGTFSSAPRALPAWKQQRETGGGALLDLAVHHVDLVRWLLGAEVVGVRATIASRLSADDTALLDLEVDGGPPVQLLATTSAAQGDVLEVLGSAATARVDRMRHPRLVLERADAAPGAAQRVLRGLRLAAGDVERGYRRLRPAPEPSFALALGAFCRAAAGQEPWRGADLADGVAALAVLEAAERSAASGAREAVHA
ncbi:Gfo/Idh/MocA family protein [Pseudokineococcus sp. 1T1Z-3]|uniref:Gfo/Idh/MocA family protein n=1 Tax=Pseudokineococcus sp. 1T1Z-3 TaxID=3132745 RepID=UPI0030992E6B